MKSLLRAGRISRLALTASVLAVATVAPAAAAASTLTTTDATPTSVPFTVHYQVPTGTDHVKLILWGTSYEYTDAYNHEQLFTFASTGSFPTGPFPLTDFGFATADVPDSSGEGDVVVNYPVNGDWDLAVAPVSSSNVVGSWSSPLSIELRQPKNPVPTLDTPASTVGLANNESLTLHGIPGNRVMVEARSLTPGDEQFWFLSDDGQNPVFDENGDYTFPVSEFRWFRDGDLKLTYWQGTDLPGVQNGGITDETTVEVAN